LQEINQLIGIELLTSSFQGIFYSHRDVGTGVHYKGTGALT